MKVYLDDGGRRDNLESGYGQIAAALDRELPKLGHEVVPEPGTGADVRLYVCPPSSMRFEEPKIPSAAYTMHELPDLPESKSDWPERLNRVELVISPTSWNKRVWEGLGVTTRIEVVPLGIDQSVYYPRHGRRCVFVSAHENLGGGSSRENWRDTLWAYCAAFSAKDRVTLRIKTWKWKPLDWEAAVREVADELKRGPGELPELEVIDDRLSGDEMRALYQGAWLFIKNANREGWGLPASEAAASGARVAATEIQPLVSHLPADTLWFRLGDRHELRYLLRGAYRRFLSEQARVSERYTWDKTAKLVSDHLASLAAKS